MVICPLAAQHHMSVCWPLSVTGTDPMLPGLQQPTRKITTRAEAAPEAILAIVPPPRKLWLETSPKWQPWTELTNVLMAGIAQVCDRAQQNYERIASEN